MNRTSSRTAYPIRSLEDESLPALDVGHWELVREIQDLEEILLENVDQAENCDSAAAFLEEVRQALESRRAALRSA
jgi:hypothetical protein